MLMRTTTRRTAVVMMMVLVAMLLVATGGSARASQHRVSAGTGHVTVAPLVGRHTASTPSSHADQPTVHVDLASTPPDSSSSTQVDTPGQVAASVTSYADRGHLAPTGRAPPAR